MTCASFNLLSILSSFFSAWQMVDQIMYAQWTESSREPIAPPDVLSRAMIGLKSGR